MSLRNRSGKAAWAGLAIVIVMGLVCSGTMFWFYGAAKQLQKHIVRINSKDPRLETAAKTARAFLPQFSERLRHPQAGDRFAVKGRFVTPVGPEFLWLKDPKTVKGGFEGTLDQVPIALQAKKGQLLRVKHADVYDLMIRRSDGSIAGGFTEIELQSRRQ